MPPVRCWRGRVSPRVRPEEDLPHIEADADRILRVFGNLLDNALKFTTAPGRIRLGAHRASGGVRFIANSGPACPRGR